MVIGRVSEYALGKAYQPGSLIKLADWKDIAELIGFVVVAASIENDVNLFVERAGRGIS